MYRPARTGAQELGRRVADIFDEVNEDLRAERMQRLLKRYGFLLVIAAVLVIVAVAGWQALRARDKQQTEAVATAYLGAMRAGSSDAPEAGRTLAAGQFAELANTAPEGYRTLARLREAALRLQAGDRPAALELWDRVAADTSAERTMRDLAGLLAIQAQLDDGDVAALEGRLLPLLGAGPWRPLAQEAQALLAIRQGQDAKARGLLQTLVSDPAAPEGVRRRAEGLLARLGGVVETAK